MPTEGHRQLAQLDSAEWGIRVVYALVFFGVFERHPNLKLVVTEVPGVIWDQMNQKMDSVFHTRSIRKDNPLSKLLSEYMATNVWLGNSFQSRLEAQSAVEIGREDRFLWGSDYPHPEGTFTYPDNPGEYPMTRLSLANTYHGLPIQKARKIIGENALEAYPRLDGGVLRQVAQRIGPNVGDLAAAPDLSNYPHLANISTLALRAHGTWH
jgi:predicted TIM-barrel fold metal-dependent hydrolase